MTTWLPVVAVLGVVIIVAVIRERRRVSAIEQWTVAHGWKRTFPVPEGGPQPAAQLVACLTTHGARLWGLVLEGTLDGVPIVVAEHENSEPGRKTGVWHTIVVWPISGATDRIVLQRGRGSDALANAAASAATMAKDAVGLSVGDTVTRLQTSSGWTIAAQALARERWLTAEKTALLDTWPHGGSFVRDVGFGAWRREGTITIEQLKLIAGQFPAIRRLLA